MRCMSHVVYLVVFHYTFLKKVIKFGMFPPVKLGPTATNFNSPQSYFVES